MERDLQTVCYTGSRYYFVDKKDNEKWYYYDKYTNIFSRCTFNNFKGQEDLFKVE